MALSENTFKTCSPEETIRLAASVAKEILKSGRRLVCLYGDLGSGKTTFTKGFGKALAVPRRAVKSPTFVFLHSYKGKTVDLHHFDLYRAEKFRESGISSLQRHLEELINREDGTIVIEWADRIKKILPEKRYDIFLEHCAASPNERKITIKKL